MKGRHKLQNILSGKLPAVLLLTVFLSAVFLLAACGPKGGSGAGGTGNTGGSGSAAATTEAPTFAVDPEDTSSFTLMVYMIGSDLESMGGSATDDIREMLAAQHSDRMQILLQTGGAASWASELTGQDNSCRRFCLKEGETELLSDLGVVNMAEPASLTDFIRFGAETAPADRYGLILWNHGAGTLMGYGMDENFESFMLEIGDLKQALEDSGIHFHFVGFDACLMATVEVAAALEDCTDYLIASEETEPSGGWVYTPFLSQMAARPGIGMEELASRIVDDFVDDPHSTKYDNNTLAVLDLRKLPRVRESVADYLEALAGPIAGNYDRLSLCRSKVRSFGGGLYEQVDILDLLDRLPDYMDSGNMDPALKSAADALRAALSDLTVYTRSMDSHSSGLALYFPYLLPDRYQNVAEIMRQIGYGEEYFAFFDSFLSYVVAEQERADVQPVADSVKNAPWYRREDVELKEETYIDPATLKVKEGSFIEGDLAYIDLEGEQWKLIDQIENMIYLDTEEFGRIELGCVNLQHTLSGSGDPYYDFDGTWISLENRIVPYYEAYYTLNEEDNPYSYGFIPAELDGREISILVWYSLVGEEEAYIPQVLGYRRETVMPFSRRSSVIDISAGLTPPDKGVHPFKEGDEILLYAYREDGSKVYPYDVPIIYHEVNGLYVNDEEPVENFAGGRFDSLLQQIALRDIFNNTYLCEGTELTYEWQELEQKPEVNSPGLGPGPDTWEGETGRYRLLEDYDVTIGYPADLFEENADWQWGEINLYSKDGNVEVFIDPFFWPEDYADQAEIEESYAAGRDYSRENLTLDSGMYGQRYIYYDEQGRWYLGQIAGSTRMRGGIYGFVMQVWSKEEPSEEMRNAILYMGNSLEIRY